MHRPIHVPDDPRGIVLQHSPEERHAIARLVDPTDIQQSAARVAAALSDRLLADELALAACPSFVLPDELRQALMFEAAERIRSRAIAVSNTVWLCRLDAAQQAKIRRGVQS